MKPLEDLKLIPSQVTVLREIHRCGAATRVDLARATGLSTQSLTRITKQMLDMGLLQEGEKRTTGRGQPAINLSVRPGSLVSFGRVMEHDQVTCMAKDLTGDQIVFLKRRSEAFTAAQSLEAASEMLEIAIGQSPPDAFGLGVGVSVSGFFLEEGAARLAARNDVEGWRDLDLCKALYPSVSMPIYVENDGRAAAIGQAVDGVGRNLDSFFLILMTKGIGGGFVHNGELIRGRAGNAGEVAKFLPRGPDLQRPTQEMLSNFLRQRWGTTPTQAEIEAAVRDSDPAMTEWLDNATAHLAPVLEAITGLLDPRAIILAGRLPPPVREALAKRVAINGVNYQGMRAPTPSILVDPETDCLSVGACALPVASFLYRAMRVQGSAEP